MKMTADREVIGEINRDKDDLDYRIVDWRTGHVDVEKTEVLAKRQAFLVFGTDILFVAPVSRVGQTINSRLLLIVSGPKE